MTRTVIVAHSHPNLRYGGGEVAAYRQFEHLKAKGKDCYFVGSTIGPEDSAKFFGANQKILSFAPNDYVLNGRGMDGFVMEHGAIEDEDWIVEFLVSLQGDIYHLHHFWNIGIGTIRRLRKALPKAKLICTLHEMTAICANHGQMVKRSGELCYSASEVACAACVARPPTDFVLRRARMMEMLDQFDVLFSPSDFLRDRFEDWGVAKGRIKVIENGLDHIGEEEVEDEATLKAKSGRFAFFGQATPTKGLDVLVRAAQMLDEIADDLPMPLLIEVHGVTKEAFTAMWPQLELPKNMRFRGRYRPQDCISIMQGYGWIVIPSIWWENSPVVIQEARAAPTPMIGSDIGGMKEKIQGWGKLFRVGDANDLAESILAVHGKPEVLREYKAKISPPLDMRGFTKDWAKLAKVSGM